MALTTIFMLGIRSDNRHNLIKGNAVALPLNLQDTIIKSQSQTKSDANLENWSDISGTNRTRIPVRPSRHRFVKVRKLRSKSIEMV